MAFDISTFYKKFLKDGFDENGVLNFAELALDDNFNFAYDILDVIAREMPDRVIMRWLGENGEEKQFTYKEFSEKSDQVANMLIDHGVKKGDMVMAVLKRHYEFWFVAYGVMKVGAVLIPATCQLMKKDYVYRFKAAGIKYIFATLEDSIRISAKITYLTNFVRYHFADNSVFADKTVLPAEEMVTSSYDKESELFCKLHVDRIPSGDGTKLRVCDDVTWKKNGRSMSGTKEPFETLDQVNGVDVRNILARDVSCSASPVNVAMKGIQINSSSAAVIHSIPGYLNHTEVIDGDHTKTWESMQSAIQYLKRYAIR